MSKSTKRRRGVLRQAWLTADEAAKIDALAKPYRSFAEFLRSLTDRRPRATKYDTEALAHLSYQIGKVGGNVNQLAKRANEGRYNADAIDDAMRDISEMRSAVLEALGEPVPKPEPDDE
jgi:hypothetical protein